MSRLKGLDAVIRNLNKEIKRIEGAGMAGLWDAGLQIQAASQRRVPVDTGNLKGSHYTRAESKLVRLDKSGNAPDPQGSVPPHAVEVGATADYALFVHENLEAQHTVGEAKFLERAIDENQGGILEIIRRRAAI